jgi:hypothetical protein
MTFCSIWTTTAATAELEYIQWLNTSPQFYPNGKTDSTIDTSLQFFPNMKTKGLFYYPIFFLVRKISCFWEIFWTFSTINISGPFLLLILVCSFSQTGIQTNFFLFSDFFPGPQNFLLHSNIWEIFWTFFLSIVVRKLSQPRYRHRYIGNNWITMFG